MKIDLLLGENPYGSTHHFAKGLFSALKRANHEVRLFSLEGNEAKKSFATLLKDPPDLTCSFSDIMVGEKPLGDMLKRPHLSLVIDRVVYSLGQLTSKYSLMSASDEEEVAFLHKLGFKKAFFFPHAVPQELFQEPLPKERPLDVVFFGTCFDIEGMEKRWATFYPKKVQTLFKRVSERVLTSDTLTLLQALADEKVDSFDLPAYLHEVDFYTRGKARIALLHALGGLKLEVFGGSTGKRGWKYYLKSLLNCKVHPPLSFEKSLATLKQAKVVLNSAPTSKQGSHERVVYALASGALPFTSKSTYLSKAFKKDSLCTYSLSYPQEAFSLLEPLLHAPKRLQEKVQAGYLEVQQNHTFDVRVKNNFGEHLY